MPTRTRPMRRAQSEHTLGSLFWPLETGLLCEPTLVLGFVYTILCWKATSWEATVCALVTIGTAATAIDSNAIWSVPPAVRCTVCGVRCAVRGAVCGVRCVVRSHTLRVEVAIVTPLRAPRVLDDPVFRSLGRHAPANDKHGMVRLLPRVEDFRVMVHLVIDGH